MLGLLHNRDNRGDRLFPVKVSRYVRYPACTRVKRTGEYLSSPDAERTPETVCPSRSSAVSGFRFPGQGARDDLAQISAWGRWSGTHACRPPGAKMPGIYARSTDARDMCPVCREQVSAGGNFVRYACSLGFTARGKTSGMTERRYLPGDVGPVRMLAGRPGLKARYLLA